MAAVTVTSLGGAAQQIVVGRHELLADEPPPVGEDLGPDPYGLLLAALGACTAMTVRLYAARKQWPLERIDVRLRHERDHTADCAAGGYCDAAYVEIDLHGPLDAEQQGRLREIATRCPVSRTLARGVDVRHAPRDASSDSSASSHAV